MGQISTETLLFKPIKLREILAANRVVISPMCQYSAEDGLPNQWHYQHISALAAGGAGIVIMEASAVQRQGRITHGDLGIWSDIHSDALVPYVELMRSHGVVPAIQIGHAGCKAGMQRPWHGNGPLDKSDAAWGELPWDIVAPSALSAGEGFLVPQELTVEQIKQLVADFGAAAARCDRVGFDLIEIHGAHGYLLHTFLSPLSNRRCDEYGGSLENRMRFALEVVETVRDNWPARKPLFFRISGVDGADNGWTLDDSVVLAGELKRRGVDVIDCSSGGIAAASSSAAKGLPRGPGFQVPIAAKIRHEVGIMTQAVGLITDAVQAEEILQCGDADLVSIAREALYNPFWPKHAAQQLAADNDFEQWPKQAGWWLKRRAMAMAKNS